jgi:ketosteroid isomerase-like protein
MTLPDQPARHPVDAATDAATFVAAYVRVRQGQDSRALGELWHPDGVLRHPTLSRPVKGSRLAAYDDYTKKRLPGLTWELLDWAARGAVLYLEWRCRARSGSGALVFDGVDRIVLRGGRIIEEIVYCDTHPLWEARDESMRRPALIDASAFDDYLATDSSE